MSMSPMAAAHLDGQLESSEPATEDEEAQHHDETQPDEEEADDILTSTKGSDTSPSTTTTEKEAHSSILPSSPEVAGRGIPQNLQLDDEFEEALAQYDGDFLAQKLGIRPSNDEEIDNRRQLPSHRPSNNPLGAPVTKREYTYAICVGVLLSFNAGYVNGSCLTGLVSQSGRMVNVASHTGTITLAALALASGDVEEFGFLTSLSLCFLLGSFLAGCFTPKPRAFRIEPTYGPTFLLGAAFLTLSSSIAAVEGDEKFIFYLASAAAGIQNGISSLYSQNLIRSTGFTGTTTDIGIFIGQFIRGNRKNTWKLIVMIFLLLAFWLGGWVSLYATIKFLQFSLLVNAILFFLIGGGVVAFLILELDVSLGAAVFGTWQWKRAVRQLQAAFLDDGAFLNDSTIAASEQYLDSLFDQFDADHNGNIDKNELHTALQQAGIRVSRRQSAQMLKRADRNGDGTISREEWRNIVHACQDSSSRESVTSDVLNHA